MSRPLEDSLGQVLSSSSVIGAGWTLTFQSLAGAAQSMYSDTDLITVVTTAGVLTADANGRWPKAYFNPSLDYKAILKDATGATIATLNPIFKADGYLTASSLSPYLLKSGGTMTGPLNFAEGASVASATSIDLDAATGNMVHITGTTTIQTVTLAQGAWRLVVFDGTLVLVNSASLILIGSDQITTAANDMALLVGEGSGVTRMFSYTLANGKPLVEVDEIMIGLADETTVLTAATGKITFRAPSDFYVDALPRANLTTAQASGNILTFDINKSGISILATKLTIDNNESTSETAATPCVVGEAVTFSSSSGLLMTTAGDFPSYTKCQFSNSGGALPTGISAATDYWTVRITATTSRLATSYVNAVAGTVIAYTNAGSGTNTFLPNPLLLGDDAQLTVDIDQVGAATVAAGAKLLIRGYRRNRGRG